jgi:hypothetical protein
MRSVRLGLLQNRGKHQDFNNKLAQESVAG